MEKHALGEPIYARPCLRHDIADPSLWFGENEPYLTDTRHHEAGPDHPKRGPGTTAVWITHIHGTVPMLIRTFV